MMTRLLAPGLLISPFTSDELLQRIKNLIASHKASYLQAVNDSRAAERLQDRLSGSSVLKPEMKFKSFSITKAEQRIVELVRLGMQDKEIAAELSISPRTVSSHLSHLYQKTDTQNRIELINLLYT
jgi:DNA-binding NarL/FixJ family response regulator